MSLKGRKMSAPVKATFWFMIASILQQSVNLITTPIFTRILSETDYGITNVYQSWLSILTIVVTMSLSMGVYGNALVEMKDEIDDFTSSMLTLTTISVILFYICFIIFKSQIENFINLSNQLINFIFLNMLLSPAMGFWLGRQRFSYKYKLSIIISVFTTISGALLSYYMVVNNNSNRAASKIIGSAIVSLIISAIIYIYILIKGKQYFNLKYWKYALTFNLPLIPHYLSNVVLAQSDRILIANIIGNYEAGIYGVAYQAATVISIVWNAINASWYPLTLRKMKEQEYRNIGKIANSLVMIAALVSGIFILFSPEIIKILAAPSYFKAVWVMPPVILGMYFTFIYSLFTNVEFYHKKTKMVMVASVFAAVVNIILNIIFIPIFGYIAAAYTTLLGYIVLSAVHYRFMKKVEKNDIYDIKLFIKISMLLISVSIIIMALYNYFIIRGVVAVIIIVILLRKKDYFINIVKNIK